MKILVVFTGGTIGSSSKDGWISPDGSAKRELIKHYEITCGNDVEFVVKEPYTILSENLSAKELNILTKTVTESLQCDYDGIIITHGTDTLQFSSVALSYIVGSDTVPILFVSSNYPLENEKANGHANFKGAVEFIKQRKGRGVFVSYKNRDNSLHFHNPLKLSTYREADDCLYSMNSQIYAEMNETGIDIINRNTEYITPIGEMFFADSSKILVIEATPGDMYSYNLDGYKAIILRPYHSGTLNTQSVAFEKFCLIAKEKKIPIFVADIIEGDAYVSSKEYERLYIKPLCSTTFTNAYIRLWIAVSRNENINTVF